MKPGNDRELIFLLCAVILCLVISALLYFWIISEAQAAEIVIEAESMNLSDCSNCKEIDGGILIQSEDAIYSPVDVGVIGPRAITVVAKGYFAGDAWPIISLFAGEEKIGSATVNSTDWASYQFEAILQGEKIISVAFMNDYYMDDNGTISDRDVAVDKIIIADIPVMPGDTSRLEVSWDDWEDTHEDYAQPEGYRIFMRYDGTGYDYINPTPADGFPDGNITDGNSGIITVFAPDGVITTLFIVVRSYNQEKESEDSEEIEVRIDKLAAILPPTGVEIMIIE